jgi:hypothetical protein
MKRIVIVLSVLALAASLGSFAQAKTGGGVFVPVRGQNIIQTLNKMYTPAQLSAGVYVGSEVCLACHTKEAGWRDTLHSHALRKPMGMYTLQPGKGVLANYLGGPKDDFMMGLDFNTLSGTPFDSLKPNAPILSYRASDDTYWIQLGPNGINLQVVATWAGQSVGNGQRYMVRIPVSDRPNGYSASIYFAPFAWSGTGYTSNASSWYTGNVPNYSPGIASSALVPLQGQNYMATCSGCHITGIQAVGQTPQGEKVVTPYTAVLVPQNSPDYPDLTGNGTPSLANIGCEDCHGPGSAHVASNGDPSKILNPSDISNNQQRSEVCLQCHVQVASAPNKTWGFPYDETDNKPFIISNPPDPLSQYQVFTGQKWPDGVHYIDERVDDFTSSAHYQGAHGIACNDCHDPHEVTLNDNQVRTTITHGGNTVNNVNVDDDSFCLACHNGQYFGGFPVSDVIKWKKPGFQAPIPNNIRAAIEAHTHHPYGAANPDGSPRILGESRCVTCHMAPTAGHGDVSGFSHTFIPAAPQDTITYQNVTGLHYGGSGNVNACASSCHRNQVRIWTDVPIDNSSPNNKFGVGYMNGAAVSLAQHLVTYFGPGGLWWNTTPSSSSSSKSQGN